MREESKRMVGGKLLMRKRKTPDLRRDQIRGSGALRGTAGPTNFFSG
jgi:hypothetical protein